MNNYGKRLSQSLFYWIIYSYSFLQFLLLDILACLNPYFIGLSILIAQPKDGQLYSQEVSILILLDYLFLQGTESSKKPSLHCLNPYFIGLSILIIYYGILQGNEKVSILILLDYLFLQGTESSKKPSLHCLNPYFIGLSILIIYYGILQGNEKVSILILLDYLFLQELLLREK